MTVSEKRILFGVYSLTPYAIATGLPYGTMHVLEESSFALEGEQIELRGGALKFPYAVEDGDINSTLSIKSSEYPDFLIELFLGTSGTAISASATGTVGTITDIKGGSLVNASTGVASIAAIAGSEADLKFGKYYFKVLTSTTVGVYASSDIDFNRGTDKSFLDDANNIVATLTITSGADTNVTGFGFKLVGGSGVIGMTVGDTAYAEIYPAHQGGKEFLIGSTSSVFPEFGAIVMAAQRSDGSMFEIDIFKLKASGLPLGMTRKSFAQASLSAKAFYSSAKGNVCKLRHVIPA